MKLVVTPGNGDIGKFQGVVSAFPQVWKGSVLDVGSRSGNLHRVLGSRIASYKSLDISPPADIVGSIEAGVDLPDRAFDVVVALDVLEHTNDIHRAFAEISRLADAYLIISLPNMFELNGRLKYLMGRHMTDKYGIPVEPVLDRHRWFFSLEEARTFIREYGRTLGWEVLDEAALGGPKRAFIRPVVEAFPNLLGKTYLAALKRAS